MRNESKQRQSNRETNGAPTPERFERFPPPLHGHLSTLDAHNARIKMFGVTAEVLDDPEALSILRRRFDESEAFTKLTAYAPDKAAKKWQKLGFKKEGRIANFFRDGTDATIWTRYSDESRAESETEAKETEVLEIALSKEPIDAPILPGEFELRYATPDDAGRISNLLRATFSEYPADISEGTIRRLITRQQSVFALLETNGEIASMASAEIDVGWKTVEISDCVTVEKHRKRRLMVAILDRLVDHVASRFKIKDFYSLARAEQVGMNVALARAGFTHDGQLVNNCRMPGGWETLNVWWRTVGEDE